MQYIQSIRRRFHGRILIQIGTHIGVEELNDKEHSYNKAVEIAIKKELKNLGLLPGDAAKRIANSVERHCPLR